MIGAFAAAPAPPSRAIVDPGLLTYRDRAALRILYRADVATTTQLTTLVYHRRQTAQERLARLYRAGYLERAVLPPVTRGGAPFATGYYRHREPCPPFVAARPLHRGRGQSPGHAYRRELYEQIVEELLAEASLGAGAIAGVVGEVGRAEPAPDRSVRDRITRERERAMARYLRDRDAAALERTMASLDREASAAANPRPTEAIPYDVAVRYVRELPETWRKAEGGSGRQLLASALFSRIEVLGIREAMVHLSAHAVRHGLAAALPAEMRILVNGRGERLCAETKYQPVIRAVNVPVARAA